MGSNSIRLESRPPHLSPSPDSVRERRRLGATEADDVGAVVRWFAIEPAYPTSGVKAFRESDPPSVASGPDAAGWSFNGLMLTFADRSMIDGLSDRFWPRDTAFVGGHLNGRLRDGSPRVSKADGSQTPDLQRAALLAVGICPEQM